MEVVGGTQNSRSGSETEQLLWLVIIVAVGSWQFSTADAVVASSSRRL